MDLKLQSAVAVDEVNFSKLSETNLSITANRALSERALSIEENLVKHNKPVVKLHGYAFLSPVN